MYQKLISIVKEGWGRKRGRVQKRFVKILCIKSRNYKNKRHKLRRLFFTLFSIFALSGAITLLLWRLAPRRSQWGEYGTILTIKFGYLLPNTHSVSLPSKGCLAASTDFKWQTVERRDTITIIGGNVYNYLVTKNYKDVYATIHLAHINERTSLLPSTDNVLSSLAICLSVTIPETAMNFY